jgi:hypothetical protein
MAAKAGCRCSSDRGRQWSWQRFALDWRPAAPGSITPAAPDARRAARNAVNTVTVTIE